jgi:hypothetical protein
MFFKDWRECDQSRIQMKLDKSKFYYIQAQAWALKGYLGGTHSYCVFWDKEWLVVELSDEETLSYQGGRVLYNGAPYNDITHRAPVISTRPYNAKWFGNTPYIVDSCKSTISYSDVLYACKKYPFTEFKLLTQNCNTFTSFLINELKLDLKRPLRSMGFKNKNWWNNV